MDFLSFAAAVGWAAIIINLVVIPFFGKGEKLHQDYDIDGALAAIEANLLIPALVQVFQKARDAQPDKRYRFDNEAMKELLQVIDLSDLGGLESALAQRKTMIKCFNSLNVLARRLWKWGLVQLLLSLGIPVVWQWLRVDEPWDLVARGIVVAAWAATLSWTFFGMFRFHRRMETFVNCLRSAKES
jgi:hypothetical protein